MIVRMFPISLLLMLILSFSCQTEEAKAGLIKPAQKVLALEAEHFRLLDAQVIDDPAASNGGAVRIKTERAFCSIEFSLPPGQYIVRVRAKAPDEAHDEFYLTVGAMTVLLKPVVLNRYDYCDNSIEFSVLNPGNSFVQFATFPAGKPVSETGMLVDVVEFWRLVDNYDF